MQDIPPQGTIADIFFPRLVARLHRERFEGSVRVSLGSTTKILYFKAGEIASAASNAEPDRLASVLIQDGRLTDPQLEMAKSRMPQEGSLGRTLIELGFLTPSELLQGARRQVRQILATCSTLKIGAYQVEPGPLPPEVTVLGIPTRRLIFDCILESPDRGSVLREIGSMESVFTPTEDLAPGLAALKLDIVHDQVGRMLDGSSTLRDLSGRTSLDDFAVSKVVLALEVLGLADLVGVPAPVAAPTTWRSIPIDTDQAQPEPDPVLVNAGAGHADPPALEQPAPEPPPIPEEELPAFAVVEESDVEWQIDPQTGERVHVGPIGVSFEGKVGPPSRVGPGLRVILAAAGAATVAIAAAILYLGRRSPESPRTEVAQPPKVARAAVPDLRPETEPAPDRAQSPPPVPAPALTAIATPSPTSVSPAPDVSPIPAVVPAPELSRPAAVSPPAAVPPPAARRTAEAPVPTQTPDDAAPMSPAAPRLPPRGSVSPFRDATRYMGALRRFDTGDAEGAARIFQELASNEPGRYTLQLMIACKEETLRETRAQSGEHGSLFFLPFQFKGRTCYRVFWGAYAGKDQARDAIASLPPPLQPAGNPPPIVSIDRLRTP